ncbi:capsule assembly Wzi family protein [Draconibacterium halophilum]|uniref:Capsule assembly Wzi family protein n=1 Tax=Draconibacterium halophilum TaxID=2706887 RepID=A0A6C0RFV1_9BACT|nr:capsule assembly Wzi family protein [Draconibacterium halophilum]QIA08545.1 capsule assembly Wzi family protein [Draconibacterium halophilum]
MITKYKKLIFFFLLFIAAESSFAQSISLNHPYLNDYYRRQQLLGIVDSTISFTSRPIYSEALEYDDIFDPENSLDDSNLNNFNGTFSFLQQRGKITLLPVSLLNQYNSHHPEGINDGSMIPARGAQMRADLGFYFKYSLLSITFNPELVYAHNKVFDGFPSGYKTILNMQFPNSKGTIDLPERIGGFHYSKFFLGQSSIRLTYKPISIGLSNENLWWGPGYKNSLLMTNSASGFLHLTLNTVRPIKTPIGSFEGQVISGRLEESGYTDGLPDDWRYLNAMVLSYQPRWVPGLFLGFTRSFMTYSEDMGSGFSDWLPVFSFLTKNKGGTSDIEVYNQRQDQRISIFSRWLFPESHAEIYFEYGREDHSWDLRDLLMEPSHSAAFILGGHKLLGFKGKRYFQVRGEITQTAASQTNVNRRRTYKEPAGTWYYHSQLKQGYTHRGQLLGAGIDPGSNTQTIEISWNRELKQVGVEFERYVHNNNFWYNYIQDFRANWVDLSTSFFANWDYKNFLVYGKIKVVRSKNYQWLYEPKGGFSDYWLPADDTFNSHLQIGITYRF